MDPSTSVSPALDALVISTAVVSLVQLSKWGFLPDKYGPLAVMVFSVLGISLYGYSNGIGFVGPNIWQYFVGAIAVMLQAAGIFGFTRASGEAVSNMKTPPAGGAGSSPTLKKEDTDAG